MLNVNDIYLDVLDKINQPENGQLSIERYNRYSWIAQLQLIDWLSGDISAKIPPEPYLSTKSKDQLSPFIIPYLVNIDRGVITKPADYYQFENMYLLGQYNEVSNCYEVITDDGVKKNTPITILDGDKYTERSNTFIDELKPSFKNPITKEIGNGFLFNPTDLGTITLEYIRYPKRAYLQTKTDPVYNDEVYDAATSTNFEWSEYARPLLTFYISDLFFNFVNNQSGKQFLAATGKTARP